MLPGLFCLSAYMPIGKFGDGQLFLERFDCNFFADCGWKNRWNLNAAEAERLLPLFYLLMSPRFIRCPFGIVVIAIQSVPLRDSDILRVDIRADLVFLAAEIAIDPLWDLSDGFILQYHEFHLRRISKKGQDHP